MKPSLALQGNQELIKQIAARYGASNVRVFGSVARGEDTERSDLDLLVDMEEDRSIWDLAELQGDVREALRCDVQIVLSDSLHRLLRDRILGEARPI
jgi:uncharacterized protein